MFNSGLVPSSATHWATAPRFAHPAPQGGSVIIAQGKAAEAAALGSAHPKPSLAFILVCRAGLRPGAANQDKGEEFILCP